ncbi:MAG: hypothetical protein FJ028_00120 [Chloroflexi bacterium]|nr:hypothetical protein [Chloroflexota bacterium]
MLLSILAAAAAAGAIYGLAIEPRRVERTFLRIVVSGLPRSVRLLAVGDLHLREGSRMTLQKLREAAEWSIAHGATAAVLLGDLIERDDEVEAVARGLAASLAPLHAMYVSGNHELDRSSRVHWPLKRNDGSLIRGALAGQGIECLDDRSVDLGGVLLHGIPWQGWRVGHDRSAVGPARPLPTVLVTHSPDHVGPLDGAEVVLALCGHTHGGQIRIPGLAAWWTPVIRRLDALAGPQVVAGVRTYVTRGLSATFPIRIAARPEVVLVDLAPRSGGGAPPGATVLEIPS